MGFSEAVVSYFKFILGLMFFEVGGGRLGQCSSLCSLGFLPMGGEFLAPSAEDAVLLSLILN